MRLLCLHRNHLGTKLAEKQLETATGDSMKQGVSKRDYVFALRHSAASLDPHTGNISMQSFAVVQPSLEHHEHKSTSRATTPLLYSKSVTHLTSTSAERNSWNS